MTDHTVSAMEIYLLRHGKAEERRAGISSDAKRRLTESGRGEMRDIASGIASLGIRPCLVASSPLVRAKATAAIVSESLPKDGKGPKPRIDIWQELKPESDILATHKRLIGMIPDARVMLVGHEPHLSSLASSMVLERHRSDHSCSCLSLNLKKGGLVMIRGNARGEMIRGFMRSLMTPRQLRMCGRTRVP